MGKPEAYVENYLAKKCTESRFMCMKVKAIGRNGFPDRFISGNGYSFLVELKSDKGSLQGNQKVMISNLRRNGTTVLVINSREMVDDLIIAMKSKEPIEGITI